jgi:hypothetical protein
MLNFVAVMNAMLTSASMLIKYTGIYIIFTQIVLATVPNYTYVSS